MHLLKLIPVVLDQGAHREPLARPETSVGTAPSSGSDRGGGRRSRTFFFPPRVFSLRLRRCYSPTTFAPITAPAE